MHIKIAKPVTKEKVAKAFEAFQKKEKSKKTIRKHFGKLKRNIDAVAYQRELRNEWL